MANSSDRFFEKLSRSDLISVLKYESEQRLYLEEYIKALESLLNKEKHEQRV